MSANKQWQVTLQKLPTNLAELKALPEAALKEPHHAAALLIAALCQWPLN